MSDESALEQHVGPIVVGVDGSASSELPLRWAAEQARLTGQELHAVISWDPPIPYDAPVTGEFDWEGDAAGTLAKTVENVLGEAAGREVVRHVVRGRPARVLVHAAGDADLLVVGSRGHGGFSGLLLGSVSQHVIAHAGCPVVVVHEQRNSTGRIVVGVDGSPESEQALRWAAGQAQLTGAELRAVIAWQIPAAYGLTLQAEADWAAHSSHTLATVVADALGSEDGGRVVQEVVEDHPADALLSAAEGADLLVVGARGRGRFTGMLLGSVSRHVAAHAACPVAVHR